MKLWNINFLPDWPISNISPEHTSMDSKGQHNTFFQSDNAAIIDKFSDTAGKGDENMTVSGLIKVFTKAHEHSLRLKGPYGYISMIPEHHRSGPDTYHVDCCYKTLGNHFQVEHADGFRLSTACCLSACVIFGEQRVNGAMIDQINTQLN